jgi:hypothetical protein
MDEFDRAGGEYLAIYASHNAPVQKWEEEDTGFVIHVEGMDTELGGKEIFHIGEETIKTRPGSFVFGPKDVPHTYTVNSGPARLLFILSPAGFEEFIYAPASRPSPRRKARLVRRRWSS